MLKQFLKAVLPAMLAFAFSGLYAIVDGFFVGQNIGDLGLAAVNVAYPLSALLQAVGTGLGMGGAVLVSIYKGKGEAIQERYYLGNTLSLLVIAGVFLMVFLELVCGVALRGMGASGEVLPMAEEYIRIVLLGSLLQIGATGFAPILRNYGGSMFAMMIMVAGFITNIVLDFLLVSVFQCGVAGAAWATIIGQGVTAVAGTVFLWKRVKNLPRNIFRLRKSSVEHIVKIGLSPFGITLSPNIVILLLNQSASRWGGETAVAAYAVISYVVCVIQLLLQGVGDGCQPLMSYYQGRGDLHHVKTVRNMAYGFSALVAAATMVLIYAFRHAIPGFFGASEEVLPIVGDSLPIFLTGFVFIAFCRSTMAYFYATHKNKFSYPMVYGEPVLLAVFLWLVFPNIWKLSGVWFSVPATQMVLAGIGAVLLFVERKELEKEKITAAPPVTEDGFLQ